MCVDFTFRNRITWSISVDAYVALRLVVERIGFHPNALIRALDQPVLASQSQC